MTATVGIVVLLSRILFAVFFIRSGIAHIRKHEGMAIGSGRSRTRVNARRRRATSTGTSRYSALRWRCGGFFVAAGEAVRFTLTGPLF